MAARQGTGVVLAEDPASRGDDRAVSGFGVFESAVFVPQPGEVCSRVEYLGMIFAQDPASCLEDRPVPGFGLLLPPGFQNSAAGPDLGFYAAGSYSLMRPPRTGRRWIRSLERSAGGWSGRGGRSWRLR